jgi:hypothetical protein
MHRVTKHCLRIAVCLPWYTLTGNLKSAEKFNNVGFYHHRQALGYLIPSQTIKTNLLWQTGID